VDRERGAVAGSVCGTPCLDETLVLLVEREELLVLDALDVRDLERSATNAPNE
jgi:hypothetical protein